MRRDGFLNVLKNDIEGLDKYSKLDSSKALLEKVPDAFDYFISLYVEAFPKGKLLENYEPKSLITNSDLDYFNMELSLIDNYSYNLAYKDFYHIQEMKYWLSCKKEVEEIGLIYGEYETIPEILEATGYTLGNLYVEMNNIMYDVKKSYREKLRQEESERKKKERDDLANKVKNSKEETARKLAELKARREGNSMEVNTEIKEKIEQPTLDLSVLNKSDISKETVDITKTSEIDVSAEGYCAFIKGIVTACANANKLSENVDNLTLKDIRMISSTLKESNLEGALKQVMDLMEKLNF